MLGELQVGRAREALRTFAVHVGDARNDREKRPDADHVVARIGDELCVSRRLRAAIMLGEPGRRCDRSAPVRAAAAAQGGRTMPRPSVSGDRPREASGNL